MDSIQRTVFSLLEDLPRICLRNAIEKKLRAHGIKLSERKLDKIATGLLNGESKFDVGILNFRARNADVKFTDDEIREIEQNVDKVVERVPAIVENLIEDTSSTMTAELIKKWPRESKVVKREVSDFRKRLVKRWGKPIESLRMLIAIARELADDLTTELPRELPDCPRMVEVLTRLHIRACQIAEEIVCLIEGGFADGAMARWRTLHEISAVSMLISQHGEELAERYVAHQIVENRKAAIQYKKFASRLNQDPADEAELAEVERQYAVVKQKYGADYCNVQGWASKHLGIRNPTIAQIHEAAGIEHLAPYYKMASHNVHANPKGIFFKLGVLKDDPVLLAGPSNAGFTDPGHSTAISLLQISAQGALLRSTVDYLIALKVMQRLTDYIGSAFLDAHNGLIRDEEAAMEAKKYSALKMLGRRSVALRHRD